MKFTLKEIICKINALDLLSDPKKKFLVEQKKKEFTSQNKQKQDVKTFVYLSDKYMQMKNKLLELFEKLTATLSQYNPLIINVKCMARNDYIFMLYWLKD